MTATGLEPWVLAIGDGGRVDAIAAQMHERGYPTTVARALSEVRLGLVASTLPALVILDTHAYAPWRVDALERITALVYAAGIRLVWVGSGQPPEADAPHVRRLDADAPLAVIVDVATVFVGQRHHARPARGPGQSGVAEPGRDASGPAPKR